MQLQLGVKVIIKNTEGQYLFIERSEPLGNETVLSWDIPGGRIDPSERLQDALKREVLEELGIELTATSTLLNAQDIFVPAKDLHVVRLTYIASQDITAIQLSDEHQNYKWASIDEIMQHNVDPYLKDSLQLVS